MATLEKDQDVQWSLQSTFTEVMAQVRPSLMAIDMPVGLADEHHPRILEKYARPLLKPTRQGSIFVPPCREAVFADSYERAKEINASVTGKMFSIQAWHLVPKIRDIDQWLAQHPTDITRLIESHPEICLAMINGGRPMTHYKKTIEGFNERMACLEAHLPETREALTAGRLQFKKNLVATDDLVDALVLGVTSRLAGKYGWTHLTQIPETDAQGIPFRLGYVIPKPR